MSPEQLSRKWSNCRWSIYRRSNYRRSIYRGSNYRRSNYRRSNCRRSNSRQSNIVGAFVAEQLSRSNYRLHRSNCRRSNYRRSICRTLTEQRNLYANRINNKEDMKFCNFVYFAKHFSNSRYEYAKFVCKISELMISSPHKFPCNL